MTAWELHQGEALAVLATLPTASVDAVVTDPPYSSGGMMRSDRMQAPSTKYFDAETTHRNFTGDNRDQRAYRYWSTLWLTECLRVTKPGGVVVVFTDWRQLPTTTDAVQAGGWVWRGLATWHKTSGRPRRGGFRNQAEFMVWGTNGAMGAGASDAYLPGVITTPVVRGTDKQHITAKPAQLMELVTQVAPAGGLVLDPFAGSASTGVGALRAGRRFLGIELSDHYAGVARDRLAATEAELAAVTPAAILEPALAAGEV